MKRSNAILIFAVILFASCRSVRVRNDNHKHYVNARPERIKYPIQTDLIYSRNSICHYKLYRTKSGRLFYYDDMQRNKKRVFLKIKK